MDALEHLGIAFSHRVGVLLPYLECRLHNFSHIPVLSSWYLGSSSSLQFVQLSSPFLCVHEVVCHGACWWSRFSCSLARRWDCVGTPIHCQRLSICRFLLNFQSFLVSFCLFVFLWWFSFPIHCPGYALLLLTLGGCNWWFRLHWFSISLGWSSYPWSHSLVVD